MHWKIRAQVQGGLLGPDDRSAEPAEGILSSSLKSKKYLATFYNIGENQLPLFDAQGFQVTKWGEEAPCLTFRNLTLLPDTNMNGSDVKPTTAAARKPSSTECRPSLTVRDAEWNDLMGEIRVITAECLSTKPQRGEVQFFNGSVDPVSWDRRRLFIARSDNGAGRIEGFLICLPYDRRSGMGHRIIPAQTGRTTWCRAILDSRGCRILYGTKAFVPCHCASCPAVRYEKLDNDSWIIRRCLQFGFNYASAFFDMPGEYHFKSRFRPRFLRRYLCHWPRASAGSMWSTVSLSACRARSGPEKTGSQRMGRLLAFKNAATSRPRKRTRARCVGNLRAARATIRRTNASHGPPVLGVKFQPPLLVGMQTSARPSGRTVKFGRCADFRRQAFAKSCFSAPTCGSPVHVLSSYFRLVRQQGRRLRNPA